MDFVYQYFPFQSIHEKEFKRESRGWQTLVLAYLFVFKYLASQVTKSGSCCANALDWLRRVAIGNDPLVAKAAAAAERSIHCPEAAGKVQFSLLLR